MPSDMRLFVGDLLHAQAEAASSNAVSRAQLKRYVLATTALRRSCLMRDLQAMHPDKRRSRL